MTEIAQDVLVVFSHGKESGPHGTKIRKLSSVARELGMSVLSVDYQGLDDPQTRVDLLLQQPLPPHQSLVLVGSSMGGYVSAVASRMLNPQGLFLLAPAFGMPSYPESFPSPASQRLCIVHGWDDDVVSPNASIEYARAHRAELHLVRDGHRLMESLPLICLLFRELLLGGIG